MWVLLFVYGPQVLASFIVLGMHWDDKNVCDGGHTLRWKWWALLSAVRLTNGLRQLLITPEETNSPHYLSCYVTNS